MTLTLIGAMGLPLIGTTLGATGVFFLRERFPQAVQRSLSGFAAGIMLAASIWSLLLPALEQNLPFGALRFIPAFLGLWCGIGFLFALDRLLQHLPRLHHPGNRDNLMMLAITLHNLPEGMAVGVAAAGWLTGKTGLSSADVLSLALGIAIQNLPEGAIISMPLRVAGRRRGRAFAMGILSGIVEPVGTAITILLAAQISALLPGFLSFAAGAMLYVAVRELIPETAADRTGIAVICFFIGFSLMMVLDVALG